MSQMTKVSLSLFFDILADITGVSRELLSYVRQTGGKKSPTHTAAARLRNI